MNRSSGAIKRSFGSMNRSSGSMNWSSRSTSLKRKKALLHARQRFHAKCVAKLRHINAYEIIVQQKSLEYLDLAFKTSNCKRKWKKAIWLQIIRCLPPYIGEYLKSEIAYPEFTTLGVEFKMFIEFFDFLLLVFQQTQQLLENEIFVMLERQIVCLDDVNHAQKRQVILNYLKIVEILEPFRSKINRYPFRMLYQSLLRTICTDFLVDLKVAKAIAYWLQAACIDENTKLEVFTKIIEVRYLEYLLCVARYMRFDFWGLWRGVGDFSARFNPVAVFFGDFARNDLARILLKYGFQYSATGYIFQDKCQYLSLQRYHSLPILQQEAKKLLEQKRPRDRMLMILDTFLTIADFERSFDQSDAIATLICISRSQPHPYVTPGELFYHLSSVMALSFHQKLVQICVKYGTEEIYDDDYREYKPRKLVHLSRCAVRMALRENLQLPEGIDDLNLEDPLKAYLLLQR